MKLLLDTHAIIWFIEGNNSLSNTCHNLITNAHNDVFVSMVSFYEMAIKLKINKLRLSSGLDKFMIKVKAESITALPISEMHISEYQNIPMIPTHHDPFDRLLIATAVSENLPIITIDKQFENYENIIQIIW